MNINGRNLCDHCFAEIHPGTDKCAFCSFPNNSEKYPTALTEGTILAGRYVVGRVLGKGGFGVTYLCYDSKERTRVAIKEYLPDSLTHRNRGETHVSTYGGESEEYFKTGAQKFYDEAKLVSRFNGNPNIISVYEFFYENNTTYFVMEYLEGTDLKNYIKENGGKISEEEALHIAFKVTEALMIVHSTDILHRDISPDNIFLCNDGKVKLIDFGAARQVIGEASKSLSVILKQGFAPLEQYQKRGKQGPWTDIYALGASLYYVLTGTVLDDAMSRIADDTLEMENISPAFAAVLGKMLEVRVEDRYQNTFELKSALSALPFKPRAIEMKNSESLPPTEWSPGDEKEDGGEVEEEKNNLPIPEKTKTDSGSKAEKRNLKSKFKELITDPEKKRKIIFAVCLLAAVIVWGIVCIAVEENTEIRYAGLVIFAIGLFVAAPVLAAGLLIRKCIKLKKASRSDSGNESPENDRVYTKKQKILISVFTVLLAVGFAIGGFLIFLNLSPFSYCSDIVSYFARIMGIVEGVAIALGFLLFFMFKNKTGSASLTKLRKLLIAFCSVVVFVPVIFALVSPELAYQEACYEYNTNTDYDYDTYYIFKELVEYKDSETKYKESAYRYACELLEGYGLDFEKAKELFEKIGDYEDSEEKAIEAAYRYACHEFVHAKHTFTLERAAEQFEELGNYRNSEEKAKAAADKLAFGKYKARFDHAPICSAIDGYERGNLAEDTVVVGCGTDKDEDGDIWICIKYDGSYCWIDGYYLEVVN